MLKRNEVRDYILNKPGAYEDFPFGEDVAVFKVCNKMFALFNKDIDNFSINLKSDPDEALYLRETFDSIIPGYHMNKKHWNTIIIEGTITDNMIFELIDKSYKLVFNKLKKSDRELLCPSDEK
ncbi:MAG: MmcQ/YjbR family DNA-binding protein [Vallitalea sp.]|jgi:predicted DNA-binding protein (MmcQ/YjbR family)|nr:MmcQ/YjbR family DNA-binding protein [Vallitalea sp.]